MLRQRLLHLGRADVVEASSEPADRIAVLGHHLRVDALSSRPGGGLLEAVPELVRDEPAPALLGGLAAGVSDGLPAWSRATGSTLRGASWTIRWYTAIVPAPYAAVSWPHCRPDGPIVHGFRKKKIEVIGGVPPNAPAKSSRPSSTQR